MFILIRFSFIFPLFRLIENMIGLIRYTAPQSFKTFGGSRYKLVIFRGSENKTELIGGIGSGKAKADANPVISTSFTGSSRQYPYQSGTSSLSPSGSAAPLPALSLGSIGRYCRSSHGTKGDQNYERTDESSEGHHERRG